MRLNLSFSQTIIFMKALSLLALFCVIAFSCSQDESKVAKLGNISFSFSQAAGADSRVADVGTPTSVLLTIKDSNGNALYENKKLSLFSFGQSFTSESLKMNIGNYTLTQFIVLDATDKALYAAPLQNTVMAKYVSMPLPLSLAVSDGLTTTVTPEVLAVSSDDQPASFGYASFGFSIVDISDKIQQFTFNELSGFVNTVEFQYDQSKVISADWKVTRTWPSIEVHNYHEQRFYDDANHLSGLKADDILAIAYFYNNGILQKVVTNKGWWDTPTRSISTKLITEYSNGHPTQMTFQSGQDYILTSSLKYDVAGNITSVETNDEADNIKYSITMTYETDINPLNGLLESPMIQSYGYFNDAVFYYSKNLPHSIISTRYFEETPYAETTAYTFTYSRDNKGRVTSIAVSARITDNNGHEFLNGPAYSLNLQYQ
jgi:hypothetical protein